MSSGNALSREAAAKQVAYWLDLCAYDMETARAMYVSQRYLYVGFMCHQVIEKGLKALFIQAHQAYPPRIHALVELAKRADVYIKMSEEQQNLLDTLEPLNIEARYPTHKDMLLNSLTESRCRELLTETEELFNWIKAQSSST